MTLEEVIDEMASALDHCMERALQRSRDSLHFAPVPDHEIERLMQSHSLRLAEWKRDVLAEYLRELKKWKAATNVEAVTIEN